MEIRPLKPTDDVAGFACGEPDLDRFLKKYAALNQYRDHIGTTYVVVEGDEVFAFVTVSPASLDRDAVPQAVAAEAPGYPMPILRLARLAVDARVQGQGVGRNLMRFVCELATVMARDCGSAGVVVDAKPGAVDFYKKFGFAELEVLVGASGARPTPTPMFLPMGEIEAARGLGKPTR
jgi:predicted N-acetyltransferase YhbS